MFRGCRRVPMTDEMQQCVPCFRMHSIAQRLEQVLRIKSTSTVVAFEYFHMQRRVYLPGRVQQQPSQAPALQMHIDEYSTDFIAEQ